VTLGYREAVGTFSPKQLALVEQARVAHREHRYDAAYEALRSAGKLGPLDPEDLDRCADAAWWLGLLPECLRLTELAHRDFLTTGHVDRAATQALDMGGLLAMRGELPLAMGWLSRARRLLEGLPIGPAHGTLCYTDFTFLLQEGQLDDAERLANDLLRLGQEHGWDDYVALGHLATGLVLLRRGRVAEAYRHMDESMLLVVAGQVDPEWAGHVSCMIVASCLKVGDLNRARLANETAYKWLEDFEHAVMFTGVCRGHDVDLLVLEGDWAAAERKADLVVRDLGDQNVEAVAEVEYQRGECHRLRGQVTEATAAYQRAAALGREPQPGAALLALASGDGEAAWEAAWDAAARASGNPFQNARLQRALAEIGLATGRDEAAAAAADRLRELAELFGTPGFVAWADHCAGAVALGRGENTSAVALLERAAASYRRLRAWCDTAAAEVLLAQAYDDLGDAGRATEHRDSGLGLLRRLGMPIPASGPHPELDSGLTAREAEVLCRVATGASNREVAEELSISEATVRRHLANIYVKLGVSTRTAAAGWAHQHGLIPGAHA
jgi:ATP/maltotriose-dependent transcriptional regulator MalT